MSGIFSSEKVFKTFPLLLEAYEKGTEQSRTLLGTEEVMNTIVCAMHQKDYIHLQYKVDKLCSSFCKGVYSAHSILPESEDDKKMLPPVIVSIQFKLLDKDTMAGAIFDSACIANRMKALPMVLIATKRLDTSDARLCCEIEPGTTHPGFLEFKNPSFWAEKCLIFAPSPMEQASSQQEIKQ